MREIEERGSVQLALLMNPFGAHLQFIYN
jgi:hypothetical protein